MVLVSSNHYVFEYVLLEKWVSATPVFDGLNPVKHFLKSDGYFKIRIDTNATADAMIFWRHDMIQAPLMNLTFYYYLHL